MKSILHKICKSVFVIMMVSTFSCSQRKTQNLEGTWSVTSYTFLDKATGFFNGVKWYTAGSKLLLNKDSSFREETCGAYMKGTWSCNADSLILQNDTMWYKDAVWHREHGEPGYDSLKGVAFKERVAYFIDGDKLINVTNGPTMHWTSDGKKKADSGGKMTIYRRGNR